PNWTPGGPAGHYDRYWQEYAFGGLSESACSRREALARLVPRLRIGDRCTLEDRFLVVHGKLRTYRIHLGSANIQMEPNSAYLCIVPARDVGQSERVMLPFEGDTLLSVILSKAFLLADDDKIKDPSIVRQIRPS